MSKKKLIVLIVVICSLAIVIRLLGPLMRSAYIDLFVVEPYENTTWQNVNFFDRGYISVPGDWTYTADDEKILFHNSEGKTILYVFKEHNTIPDGFPEMSSCDKYKNHSSLAQGLFDTGSNFFSLISPDGNYYFGTYYKSKYGIQYFGSLVAYYQDIDEETFRNILTSHRE